MVEKSCILLSGPDFISGSTLTLSIQEIEHQSHVYQIGDVKTTFHLFERISSSPSNYPILQKEIFIVVDLNLEGNKGYSFLGGWQKNILPCFVHIMTVKDENRKAKKLPHTLKSLT